jgi:hypothetical protein
MTAQPSLSNPEIRTFGTLEEIRALKHFVENAALNPSNYKRLFGDYHLSEKVRCCVQKENGKLCDEPHNHGWLAERLDGKLTLVGGDCGVNKFGADRRLMVDLNHYRNEKMRQARIASLSEAITAKTERIETLAKMRLDMKALEDRVRQVTSLLGTQVVRRLQDMVRTRHYEVVIKATKRREYLDPSGRTKYEDNSFQHVLGTLAGLELATNGAFAAVYDSVNDIVRAYQLAENLIAEPDLRHKSKEVNAVAGRLQRYEAVLQNGHRLLELERNFFGNDYFLFCFLSGDKIERTKAAKLAMLQTGKKSEQISPADWLSRRETIIKEQLEVHDISVR